MSWVPFVESSVSECAFLGVSISVAILVCPFGSPRCCMLGQVYKFERTLRPDEMMKQACAAVASWTTELSRYRLCVDLPLFPAAAAISLSSQLHRHVAFALLAQVY
eukprot:EC713402.1.p1 GENE.EC713402.1~~EC713402.1.p1  ORF type:complete len:106 (+),score=2.45 EC713402.1:157-474(+)